MITWTPSGLVRTPSTVQIRCMQAGPKEFKAGAPMPLRSLSVQEFRSNLQYFRFELDTPRTIPCTSLTLSGLNGDDWQRYECMQEMSFDYITLHLNPSSINWNELERYQDSFQRISIPINQEHQLLSIPAWAISKTTIIISLEKDLSHWLPQTIQKANTEDWNPFVFLYPFPKNTESQPLSPQKAIHLLEQLTLNYLKKPIIKGLPYCLANATHTLFAKTTNRWYVDAQHQREKALLFFPDIACYYKDDQCRFCQHNEECDGFFLEYLKKYKLHLQAKE